VQDGQLGIHPPGAPISPLGYGIWADGVGLVLNRLHDELPGVPLLVAEYGSAPMMTRSGPPTCDAA
jgi:hypothetical protein